MTEETSFQAPFLASARAMHSLGWSVFPQDRHERRPSRVLGQAIRPKTEFHVDETLVAADTLRLWETQCPGANVAVMFGPAMTGLFALDLDVLDEARADRIRVLAEEHLGDTPMIRIGRAPKAALFYRTAPGEALVPSSSMRLADENGGESGDAVEILSTGKTITINGIHHKTGHYYKWIGAIHPSFGGPMEAPEVAAEQIQAFLAAVRSEFPAVQSSSNWGDAGDWATADSGKVVSVRVPHDGEKIRDGRSEVLRDLVWSTTRANGRSIVAATHEDLKGLVIDIATAVTEEFGRVAILDGRWAPAALRIEAGRSVSALADKIRRGDVKAPRSAGVTTGADGTPRVLPVIELTVGEIADTVDRAEAALTTSGRGVYQRGGVIVQIGAVPVMTFSGRETTAQRIFPINERALLEHVSCAARFEKYNAKTEENVVITPPLWVATHLQARAGRLRLPVLSGVLTAPTMRNDGTILSDAGYDAATGLLLEPTPGMVFPTIPEAPTLEQAQASLAIFENLISDFPFVNAAHRSVALACFLTAAIRRTVRTAPLFAFSATAPGSGKSKLVDIASVIATGSEAGVSKQGSDEAEDGKILGALLMSGAPVITIDNCERGLGGDLLCQMLTQTTVLCRILGKSETPELATNALVCATGQGLTVVGDMVRRTLLCKLDPACEQPELREFDIEPVAWAQAHRGELVAAALTVLKAFRTAGSPKMSRPLGSFEGWSTAVRDALIWSGHADPVDTMTEARALDPKLDSLNAVLAQWVEIFGSRRITARDMIASATEQVDRGGFRPEFVRPDFREALLAVAGDGGAVSGRRLGKWISAHAGRIVGGRRIVRDGAGHGGVQNFHLDLNDADMDAVTSAEDAVTAQARAYQSRVTQISLEARAALGSVEAAAKWLTSPQENFLGATPEAYLHDDRGFEECRMQLGLDRTSTMHH